MLSTHSLFLSSVAKAYALNQPYPTACLSAIRHRKADLLGDTTHTLY